MLNCRIFRAAVFRRRLFRPRLIRRLYVAATAQEAADYVARLPNNPYCARLCLMQTISGTWAVWLTVE